MDDRVLAEALRQWSHRDIPPPPKLPLLSARVREGDVLPLLGRRVNQVAALAAEQGR